MRVAIVHDTLVQFGGAERVLMALMELFPHAPVYTLLYDRERAMVPLDEKRIRTSFLQRIPGARRYYHYFPLLMPLAVEQFDLSQYDVVLSDTYSFAKGVVTGSRTLHLSYCFTPTRYVWDDCHQYVRDFARLALFLRLAPAGLSYIRLWDYLASQRVDGYFTLSKFVAKRIEKYYRRQAQVIPPPVDVERFTTTPGNDGYYLVVSRLVPYKRTELAIAACERLGRRLKIVGTGPELSALTARAGRFTELLGFVSDTELPSLYAGARALLFPQEEDFGITPLEAAASGKPTIAYASGGAMETVVEGVTGVFFREQTTESLMTAMQAFEEQSFDSQVIRTHAERFSRERFLTDVRALVEDAWEKFRREHQTRL